MSELKKSTGIRFSTFKNIGIDTPLAGVRTGNDALSVSGPLLKNTKADVGFLLGTPSRLGMEKKVYKSHIGVFQWTPE